MNELPSRMLADFSAQEEPTRDHYLRIKSET